MFSLQKKAIEILKNLKFNLSAVALKADFEAEGISLEELVFLNRVAASSGLNLVVKIGGCEAIFDLKQAQLFGACAIMVPVVESAFALKKFKFAIDRIFGADFDEVSLIMNVETETCVKNLKQILQFGSSFLNALVIGRVDLSSSLNLGRSEIDSDLIFSHCKQICKLAGEFELPVGLGGALSAATYDQFLTKLKFSSFETRKVVFKNVHDKLLFKEAVLQATKFEILCLKFKSEFFKKLSLEDEKRLKLLEGRL